MLAKTQKAQLEVAELRMMLSSLGVVRMNRIKNGYIGLRLDSLETWS